VNPNLKLGAGGAILRGLTQTPPVRISEDEAQRMLNAFVHNAAEMIRGEADRAPDPIMARVYHLAADLIDPEGRNHR
jgi:hypothetical protein